jgi:hypothetical protein
LSDAYSRIRPEAHNSGLNYTIALLVGCGCETLADCRGGAKRKGEKVFAELLPSDGLQVLANRLYGALRDGLAHGFDTIHLSVDGAEHQIYLDSRGPQGIAIVNNSRGIGLRIGIRSRRNHCAPKLPISKPSCGRMKMRVGASRTLTSGQQI